MNKDLEESVTFFGTIIPQLEEMDVTDRDGMWLEGIISLLKRNPLQTWTATNIASRITKDGKAYRQKIGELATDHCKYGILTFDRSGMLKVWDNNLSLYCWNPGYVKRLEARQRKLLDFDRHAEAFMENEQATLNALVELLPAHRIDPKCAQMVYDYVTVYIESNGVAPHVTNLQEYRQNKLPH
ncbi:MAG: hypothetical protein PHC66_02930 [Candidatus Nanoarchaeia archaeon]|nr:hypothetical protein [Candidatus Nanoarchaeia archaeon]MDD5239015.1 hypothetical protein [Candidatus Nanoarchaeia archaeon]